METGSRPVLRIAVSSNSHELMEFTGSELVAQSEALAGEYVNSAAPSFVLLLLPHSLELFLLQIGLVLRGHWPAVLPWPTSRIDPEKYQRNLLHQLADLPADQIVTLPRLAANLSEALPYAASTCRVQGAAQLEEMFSASVDLGAAQARPGRRRNDPGDETLFLQFSGGTTGVQKCVAVTAPMLSSQFELLRDALAFGEEDCVVSWLPMYHDMGLIACLWLPLWAGGVSVQFGAADWLLKPDLLFEYITRYRGTFSWLPNFAFSYLAQQKDRIKGEYSLHSMRAWINCSEPVRAQSMKHFCDTFAGMGVRPEALQASYAMAESVFAVTQTEMGKCPPQVSRKVFHAGCPDGSLSFNLVDGVFASSGRPLRNTEVRIAGPDGMLLGDSHAGEIQIRTPSLFAGYWTRQGFLTDPLSCDGWYSTGDYGFLRQGELFVIGRLKDIIIIGGQNIFPEDVELAVNTLQDVYPGRVVAFGVDDPEHGTESMAVVAELKPDYTPEAARRMENEIRKLVRAAIGIAPRYVSAVPQRWIVKSTAGKISRRDTRARFLQEKVSAGQPAVTSHG